MDQVAGQLVKHDLTQGVPNPRHKRWALLTSLPLLIMIVAIVLTPQAMWNALQRFANPWSHTPRFTFTELQPLPREIVVPYAEPFQIQLALKEDSKWKPETAHAWMGDSSFAATQQQGHYAFELPGKFEPQSIRVRCGDAWAETRIVPTLRPELESIEAIVTLPKYLEQDAPLRLESRAGGTSVLRGSQVSFLAKVQENCNRQPSIPSRPISMAISS